MEDQKRSVGDGGGGREDTLTKLDLIFYAPKAVAKKRIESRQKQQ